MKSDAKDFLIISSDCGEATLHGISGELVLNLPNIVVNEEIITSLDKYYNSEYKFQPIRSILSRQGVLSNYNNLKSHLAVVFIEHCNPSDVLEYVNNIFRGYDFQLAGTLELLFFGYKYVKFCPEYSDRRPILSLGPWLNGIKGNQNIHNCLYRRKDRNVLYINQGTVENSYVLLSYD